MIHKAPEKFADWLNAHACDEIERHSDRPMDADAIYAAAIGASGYEDQIAKYIAANLELHQENADKDARIAELEKAPEECLHLLNAACLPAYTFNPIGHAAYRAQLARLNGILGAKP